MRGTVIGRRRWLSLVLPVLLGLWLVPEARSQSPTTIMYGAPTATPDITTVGVYFAIENGYFKREGLDVQVTRYPARPPRCARSSAGGRRRRDGR